MTQSFRTEIQIQKSDLQIEHHSKIMTLGSCFASNMAEKFQHSRFDICDNPFGVLYNPVSIKNSLQLINSNKKFKAEDLIEYDGLLHSFFHHSTFSSTDSDECVETINAGLKQASSSLAKTDVLIITFGTAYVYRHRESGLIVSNCHKLPANKFDHFRLSIDKISKTIVEIVSLVHAINKNIKIIFSVSPIRYLKYGAHENQLSKSTLLLSLEAITNSNENCHYFPAFEIMMDDLRDYRFYEDNLLHPNQTAIDYIWEKFSNAHLSEKCRLAMIDMDKLSRAVSHRPHYSDTPSYRQFVKKQLSTIKELRIKYPYLDLDKVEASLSHLVE